MNNQLTTDCPICMARVVFPVQLDCEHIFCYLCIKGVTNGNNLCPLCRQSIQSNAIKHPKFVRSALKPDRPFGAFESMQWFYEGKRGTGYWAYDHLNCQLIESAFNCDQKICEIVISGVVYCIDFVQQIQYPKDRPQRKRNVKRDLLSNIETAKGIAGVSKYLVPDLFVGQTPQPEPDSTATSDEPNSSNNRDNESDNDQRSDEQNRKRIKLEIKEEPKETDDSV